MVGGVEPLAARLNLAPGTIRSLILGRIAVPQSVFLQVVDILSAQEGATGAGPMTKRGDERAKN